MVATTIAILIFSLGKNIPERLDPTASTPEQVVADYQLQTAEKWAGFTQLDTDLTPSGLIYESGGRQYSLQLAHVIAFVAPMSAGKSIETTQDEAEKVLARIKFKEVSRDPQQALFENVNKLCQVRDISVDNRKMYSFGCVQKQAADEQVALSNSLFSLYEAREPELARSIAATPLRLFEQKVSETVAYATLSFDGEAVTEGQSYPRLLFGSINGQWEYVANVNNSAAVSDGKRSISDEDLIKINDGKWQGALSNVY